MNELTRAVKRAVEAVPCSTLKVAKAAGVPHSTLSRAFNGERNITPAVADKLAVALDAWGDRCAVAARAIRRARTARKGAAR